MELKPAKFLVLLAALTFIAPPVLAAERSLNYGETPVHDFIPQGDFQAYAVSLKPGDVLEVRLAETNSVRVDFYLTNYSAYLAYSHAIPNHPLDFYFVGGGDSLDNVSSIEYAYTAVKGDRMVVLVDNSNRTDHGARSLGGADIQGKFTVREYIWNLRTIAIVAAVGFIFFLITTFAIRSKRARPRARHAQELDPTKRRRFALRKTKGSTILSHRVHPKMAPTKKPAASPPPKRPAIQNREVKPAQRTPQPVPRANQDPHRKPLSPKKGMRGR